MKITFLGTGTSQGVPVIACDCHVCKSLDFRDKRLRTSILIEVDGLSLVVDTGPDFRQQMLRERVTQLDAIIYTHEHKDHTAGLDDVRSFNFAQQKDMPVYGEQRVLEQLKREFAYAFTEKKYPGVPQIQLNEINHKPFEVQGLKIIPIRAMHYKLPVLGFRIGDFTYLTDANYLDEENMNKIRGSKVFVLNGLQHEPHLSHFTLEEAVDVAQKLEVEKAYFTHISHKLGLHKTEQERLPENMALAYDGLILNLS